MNNSFKKIVKVDSSNEIENVIESWAKKHGFKHENDSAFPKVDDMTYSFSFEEDSTKTLVFISLLDDEVFIETIAVKSSFQCELSKMAIEDLLKKF